MKMIQEKKPDIVITDIRMPGLNGVELMRKTRENGIQVEFIWLVDTEILNMPAVLFSWVRWIIF